ncbi:hypothetical protein ElyMa_001036900 [Elysia marginata]|uniref:CTNNB1 binding N-teminal domain-containing protein n=1 Tax=Elysia marginata TaxID=1093978 RepID=A0AAV4HNJ3_9GAST|nr:hypothetical protein ElyMa_001036900 [Elysia marginata]
MTLHPNWVLLQTKDAVKLANSALENEEDDPEMHDSHVKFKDYDEAADPYGKSTHLLHDGYYDSTKTGGSLEDPSSVTAGNGMVCGPYVWPPISINSPYYSMALMANAANYAYAPLTAYSMSGPGDDVPTATTSTISQLPVVTPLTANLDGYNGPVGGATQGDVGTGSVETSDPCQATSGEPTNGTSVSQPDNGGGGVGSSAVLQASSTTLQTQSSVSSEQHATAAFSEAAVITPSSTVEDLEPIPDSHKIFPSDYLFSHQRTASGRLRKDVDTGSTASAGISNFPKQTAVMMLRTLELQETI